MRNILLSTLLFCVAGCASIHPTGMEKKILSAKWTTEDFSEEIGVATKCQPVGILIETRGYLSGDPVVVVIDDKDNENFQVELHGRVDPDGMARLPFRYEECDETAPDLETSPDLPSGNELVTKTKKEK